MLLKQADDIKNSTILLNKLALSLKRKKKFADFYLPGTIVKIKTSNSSIVKRYLGNYAVITEVDNDGTDYIDYQIAIITNDKKNKVDYFTIAWVAHNQLKKVSDPTAESIIILQDSLSEDNDEDEN